MTTWSSAKKEARKPDKPFSGKFILRVPSELHHKIYLNARRKGISINNWIIDVLKES